MKTLKHRPTLPVSDQLHVPAATTGLQTLQFMAAAVAAAACPVNDRPYMNIITSVTDNTRMCYVCKRTLSPGER